MKPSECDQPWFEMQIEYNRQVRCCCYWTGEEDHFDPAREFSVAPYWNSRVLRAKRAVIASGKPRGTGCQGCQYLMLSGSPRFLPMPDWLNEKQRRNYEAAIRHYENRDETVASLPIKYYINFGLACNLDCVMCSQTPLREGIEAGAYHVPAPPANGSSAPTDDFLFKGQAPKVAAMEKDRRQVPVELLKKLKPELTTAAIIAIIGGEPLAVPNCVEFIDTMGGDPDYENVLLQISTNGTLLEKRMDKLLRLQRIGLFVSLDSSVAEVYEYIRRKARWSEVERNLLAFKETGLKHGRQWRVNIAGVIMKSTIATLPEFAQWCSRHDFPVNFVPMQSMTYAGLNTDSQDVFNNPSLLKEIPDWEEKFHRAFEIIAKRGWDGQALRVMHERLRHLASPLGKAGLHFDHGLKALSEATARARVRLKLRTRLRRALNL